MTNGVLEKKNVALEVMSPALAAIKIASLSQSRVREEDTTTTTGETMNGDGIQVLHTKDILNSNT